MNMQAGAGECSPPRLEAVWFGGGAYERMATVLHRTASAHCPSWTVNVRRIVPGEMNAYDGALISHVDNSEKLEHWNAIVQAAADGDRILLIDADTFVTNRLDHIWRQPFDLAYTVKESRFPFNGGVVFVRVSGATRKLFEDWRRINAAFLADAAAHAPYRARYGGINQAAFGCLLERGVEDVRLARLPCREWNCEDSSWKAFHPGATRIVHVKGALRRHLFGVPLSWSPTGVRALAGMWRTLEGGPQPERKRTMMKVKVIRAFHGAAGAVRAGNVIEAPADRARAWEKKGLVAIIGEGEKEAEKPDNKQAPTPDNKQAPAPATKVAADDLAGLTNARLHEIAKAEGVAIERNDNKATLVEKIAAARAVAT